MRRGLYRIHGTDGRPDDIRVDDDGIETPVEEQLYRSRGYSPPVEDLPWQEDRLKRSSSAAASDRGAGEMAQKAAREKARQEFLARFRGP